ncbi:MAG TPA: hypothetical protein VLZ84_11710 [Asticcacaulis sp.]|nr:hypothetical protein [Asticcacaulis sp.]
MERRAKQMADKINASTGKITADKVVGRLNQGFTELSNRLPAIGSDLAGLGPVGIAAGAGLGAFTLALGQAREAMNWADDIQALADHIGVSVEYLQKMQFAAGDADVEIGALNEGLQSLNGSLGAIQSGVGAAKIQKAFDALGIKPEQLKRMHDASDLLPLLADRISQVGTRAQQVQIAKKLGIESLLPLLQGGADGLKNVTDRAEELGLVIDNKTVGALADMNREVEIAQQRLDVQLKKAFLGLAPAITGATTAIADFAAFLNKPAPTNRGSMGEYLLNLAFNPNAVIRDSVNAAGIKRLENAGANGGSDQGFNGKKRGRLDKPVIIADTADKPKGKKTKPAVNPLIAEMDALYKQGLTETERAQNQYREDIKKLNEAFAQGLVSDLQRQIIKARLDVNLDQTLNPISEIKPPKLGDIKDRDVDTTAHQGERIVLALTPVKEMYNSIADAAEYSFSRAGASFEDFSTIFTQELQSMAAAWAASKLGELFFGKRDGNGDRSGGFIDSLNIPGFASGTNSAPGGLAVVGERGREIVKLPRGSSVLNNMNTESVMRSAQAARGGGSSSINLNMNLSGANGDATIRSIVIEGVKAAIAHTDVKLKNYDASLSGRLGQSDTFGAWVR